MTIEEFIIGYLSEELGVTAGDLAGVHGSIPHPLPDEFVTVEKVGESVTDLIPTARLAVRSWSTSLSTAAALDLRVGTAMLAAVSRPEISRCGIQTSYNDPDLDTNKPRYSSTFEVVYML